MVTTITDRTPEGFGPEPVEVEVLELPNRSSYERFGQIISDDDLSQYTPEFAGIETTKTHRPVPIAELADNLKFALDRNGYNFGPGLHVATGAKDAQGETALTNFESKWVVTHDNIDSAVGRHNLPAQRVVSLSASYDKKRAAQLSFGLSIMVCGNGLVMFNAEFMSKRKQTPGLESDQYGFIFGGVANGLKQYGYQSERIEQLENTPFSGDQMKIAACNMASNGVLNPASIMKVVNEYETCDSDKADEIQQNWSDRNLWSAVNCVTAVQQGSAGHRANIFGQASRDVKTVELLEATTCN